MNLDYECPFKGLDEYYDMLFNYQNIKKIFMIIKLLKSKRKIILYKNKIGLFHKSKYRL